MSAVDDPETVVLVHGWMHVLCGDTAAAEDWAVGAFFDTAGSRCRDGYASKTRWFN